MVIANKGSNLTSTYRVIMPFENSVLTVKAFVGAFNKEYAQVRSSSLHC